MLGLFYIIIMLFSWMGTPFDSAIEAKSILQERDVPEITLKEFRSKNHCYCETFNYEITDIYGHGDTCSVDPIYLILDNDLKAQGFETIHSGRGNWQCGWRFVELTLKKGDCECTITKKHWSKEYTKDSSIVVTEQIWCNQKGKVNFKLGD